MRWPFVSRARYDDALTEAAGLRRRVLNTEDRHDEVEDERRRLAGQYAALEEQYVGACIVNECLTSDLAKARTQPAENSEDWQTRYEDEKRRADRLQRRLDDALGLNTSQIADGRLWQHTRTDKRALS
ncbi:hypothetical protein [Streptomyces sp. NPDC001221]